ncbi:Alpha-mannosidase 2 [Nymphon striatum]|nr:Alpha-mannosidase 2 [Nymphon striatum]
MRGCRKVTAALGATCFLVACFIFHRALELVLSGDRSDTFSGIWASSDTELNVLENRMKKIENELGNNQKTISEIKDALANIVQGDSYRLNRLNRLNDMYYHTRWKEGDKKMRDLQLSVSKANRNDCQLVEKLTPDTSLQMLDVYNTMSFENRDGGVWKQGWKLSYDKNQWSPDRPLKVFVVPHSHNDPGWLKTFEKYFADQSKHILDNMITKLGVDSRRRFIWAEISYLSMWWETINNKTKDIVKKYVENGQLEIVTGGWVMTDEASAHYFAMLDQLIEGHQWLYDHLGVKSLNGWAIDPFGLSSTMAYLLKKTGLQNMVIQRVHYSVKKYFAQQKSLEFYWRQAWDGSGDTDMFCHMMPFYSYDIPHTCGPDPKVCCQFDFKRLPGGKVSCPWRIAPVAITDRNVHAKSELLLDQYRKKSQIFKTNTVLIQLGDDFRFDKPIEWDQQFNNYQRLFDYMNKQKDWNVQIQFGTLNDYFSAMHKDSEGTTDDSIQFPSLSGDFFTYADRDDNYWSGYYTSRPFYKNMDRQFEAKLRATEIMFSMFRSLAGPLELYKDTVLKPMMKKIVLARRTLGLFQHHDGITGTAKDHVVIDYAKKMLKAWQDLDSVIGQCVSHLLLHPGHGQPYVSDYFSVDDVKVNYNTITQKRTIDLILVSQPKILVLYNALARKRQELVTFRVSSPYIEVTDMDGNVLLSQTNPVWDGEKISKTMYDVYFMAEVPALGLMSFKIKLLSLVEGINPANEFASITFYNENPGQVPRPFSLKSPENTISIQNSFTLVRINSETGTMQSVYNVKDGREESIEVQFVYYGTREKGKEKSGAYLFLPGGAAKPLVYSKPQMRVVQGPLLSYVTSFLPTVQHIVCVKNSPGIDGAGIQVNNIVDVTSERNKELVMRIKTKVMNGEDFYTDLNGFQIVKRTRMNKIPLQGNVYPMPSAAYIEDQSIRFTVLSGQSLGVASMNTGWLEIFLDRRLMQDDNRGVAQGVTDNLKTPSSFIFMWEKTITAQENDKKPTTFGLLSLTVHNALLSLIHPVITLSENSGSDTTFGLMTVNSVETARHRMLKPFSGLLDDLPCNTHLLNIRTFTSGADALQFDPNRKSLVLLHELGFDCNFEATHLKCQSSGGKIVPRDIFPPYLGTKWSQTSLSALFKQKEMDQSVFPPTTLYSEGCETDLEL